MLLRECLQNGGSLVAARGVVLEWERAASECKEGICLKGASCPRGMGREVSGRLQGMGSCWLESAGRSWQALSLKHYFSEL